MGDHPYVFAEKVNASKTVISPSRCGGPSRHEDECGDYNETTPNLHCALYATAPVS
jgi:hypothetical protein